MADPSMQPLKELGELAARPRQKLTEYALEAEAEERAKREARIAEQQADEADGPPTPPDADEPSADAAPRRRGRRRTGRGAAALDDDRRTAGRCRRPTTGAATPSDGTDAGTPPGSSLP